ncbi:MAG: hypothetical protein ACOY0T_29715 [Myxococcota bacterium]
MRARALFSLLASLAVVACATYREDLNRGQRLYEENQYEHALAIWRSLEHDTDSLSFNDQARYAYLRGMTDYRLGFRADARHWLAIAKATEQEHPGGLAPEWQERLAKSLDELNKEVYGGSSSETAADANANGATPATSAPANSAAPATSATLPDAPPPTP